MRSFRTLSLAQKALLPLTPLVLIGGLVQPLFGLLLLPLMAAIFGLALSQRSRRWCGAYCARGSWLDLLMAKVSRNRTAPAWLGKRGFRQAFRAGFMALFAAGLAWAWGSWLQTGRVLVAVCAATTAIAVAVGRLYRPRTWCSFCPMATMQITLAKVGNNNAC